MIQIEVNNIKVPLKETSVRFEYFNNLFNDTFIQGDYTFPFGAAINEDTRKAFGFLDGLDVIDKKYEFDCIIYINNQNWNIGKVIVINKTKKTLNLSLSFGFSGNSFIEKSLKDYDYGGKIIENTGIVNYANLTATNTDWHIYPVAFIPHKNVDFYGANNTDFCEVVNKMDIVSKQYLYNTSLNKHTLVPWPYLFAILNHIANTEGFSLIGSFSENLDAQKITLYNNYSLDQIEDFYTIYIQKSNNQYVNETTAFINFLGGGTEDLDKDGCWDGTTNYTIQAAGLHTIDIKVNYNGGYCGVVTLPPTVVPFTWNIEITGVGVFPILYDNINNNTYPAGIEHEKYLTYSFNASAGDIGRQIRLKPVFNLTSLPGVVFTGITIRPQSYILIVNTATVGLNIFSKEIDIRNHVPEISVGDLFDNLRSSFGLLIDINSIKKTITLNFNKDAIARLPASNRNLSKKVISDIIINIDPEEKGYTYGYELPNDDKLMDNNFKTIDPKEYLGAVNTLAGLGSSSLPGKIKYVKNINRFYITSNVTGPMQWNTYCDGNDVFYYGNKKTELKSIFMPLLMDIGKVYDSALSTDIDVVMPIIKQAGSSNAFGNGINEAIPRLMFNHGLQITSGAKKYILGSCTNYNEAGDKLASFSLLTGGDDGLHKLFASQWIELLMNPESYEADFNFNLVDLFTFSQYEPIYIFNRNYLIKSANVEISNGIKPFKMYLIKGNS